MTQVAGHNSGAVVRLEATFDFSKLSAASTATDVHEVLSVPANTLVLGVAVRVIEASAVLDDFDLGDGDDPNGYFDALDATSEGFLGYEGVGTQVTLTDGTPNTVVGYQTGRFYSTADTIDITQATVGNVVDGKIQVIAFALNLAE